MYSVRHLSLVIFLFIAVTGCAKKKPRQGNPGMTVRAIRHAGVKSSAPGKKRLEKSSLSFNKISRSRFNRLAVRLNLPLFWVADKNRNRRVDPAEIAGLMFYPDQRKWVEKGRFTKAFIKAYKLILKADDGWVSSKVHNAEEAKRRSLVIRELDQGRPTLIYNDLRKLTHVEKRFVKNMMKAAKLTDRLYARQNGLVGLAKNIPADDRGSQSLFRRNWGPKCKGPKTEKLKRCTGLPGGGPDRVDIYPADIQKKGFCKLLGKHKDAKQFMAPFMVVRKKAGRLVGIPYTEAYHKLTSDLSRILNRTARELTDPGEKALRRYIRAAAKSFRTNNWEPADEAWAKMNALNSKWYLRIGPDEVYWEPCSRKAGFHLTLARINSDSLKWQRKLSKVKQEMENRLAAVIGAPYKARKVGFHLPDFINIILNAGDDRHPFGATIGQSLPNWGPVANEGRGRTVAMTNLYTDPDSMRIRKLTALSLLSNESMHYYVNKAGPGLLSTILHEAAHNLGPSHEYKVGGKKAPQIFGGPLASTLEELKAQTAALWYIDFLVQKKLITKKFGNETYLDSLRWALGHISRGMYNTKGKPKPYSQLAAIQFGFLMDEGAIVYNRKTRAANKKDLGAFTFKYEKFPSAVEKLMRLVGRIKGRGNKAEALELIRRYVDGRRVPFKMIKERMLRYPKASFVYALDL